MATVGPAGRGFHAMTRIGNQFLLIGGDTSLERIFSDLWQYCPDTDKWSRLDTLPDIGITGCCCECIPRSQDKIVIFGGKILEKINGKRQIFSNQLFIYELKLKRLMRIGKFGPKRAGFCCALIGHKIWIFGGISPPSKAKPFRFIASLISLDLADHSFSKIPAPFPTTAQSTPSPRAGTAGAQILNRFFLIFGGRDSQFILNDLCVFDTVKSVWGSFPPPAAISYAGNESWPCGRIGSTLTYLPAKSTLSQSVLLLFGGSFGLHLASPPAWLLILTHKGDISTFGITWVPLTTNYVPRWNHTATLVEERDEIWLWGGALDEQVSHFSNEFSVIPLSDILSEDRTTVARPLKSPTQSGPTLEHPRQAHNTMQWSRGALVGRGSYGSVYAGLNLHDGSLIAAKEIRIPQREERQRTDEILREISILQELEHPHIVKYLGTELDPRSKVLWIFMEYIPGGSLSDLLSNQFPNGFPLNLIRKWSYEIIQGIQYLHDRSILHRDLKGANMLLAENGCVKVADFGSSKRIILGDDPDIKHSIKGTPMWMSPELVRNGSISFASDIWSFGATLLELITGKIPWTSTLEPGHRSQLNALRYITVATESGYIPPEVDLIPSNHPRLRSLALSCLQLDPKKRPTAEELLRNPFFVEVPSGQPSTPFVEAPRHTYLLSEADSLCFSDLFSPPGSLDTH